MYGQLCLIQLPQHHFLAGKKGKKEEVKLRYKSILGSLIKFKHFVALISKT